MIRSPSLFFFLLLAVACGSPVDRGTFVSGDFRGTPGTSLRGLSTRAGEVVIVEGDGLVSTIGESLGIRFDDEVDDLARVTARFADEGLDEADLLVLFTTFDDRGSGGPAYYVPFFDDVRGTGGDDLDQRAMFGVTRLEGIVNMKQATGEMTTLFVHEVAHRHLARLEALIDGSTTTAPLLGRQNQHWHALLHTQGSVLGGHGFVESTPGRFVVSARNETLSDLDLYGLGLLAADEVRPFFFVADAVNDGGFTIPREAQLTVATAVFGRRVDVAIEHVVARVGVREPASADAPSELRLRYGLLTAPGEAATSMAVLAAADRIERARIELDRAWRTFTRDRGSLCSTIDPCTETPIVMEPGCSCSTYSRRSADGWSAWWVSAVLLAVGARARRPRTPTRAC